MFPALERLSRKYLRNPLVDKEVSEFMKQNVIMVRESEKLPRLYTLLEQLGDKTAIVYINSRTAAYTVAKNMDEKRYRATTIHGGKSQEQRKISLEGFKTKKYNVMVTTDAVGSEIDTHDLAFVINYHMPWNIAAYKDHIGLNRRIGKTGVATTFLTLHDTEVFYDLKQVLIQSNSVVPSELAKHEASKFKPGSVLRPRQQDGTVYANNQ